MSLLVAIPAHNEAANLPDVVHELREVLPQADIAVIDDASSDGTSDAARAGGCTVVRLPLHLGYGGAVQAGVKLGLRRGAGVVVTFDGDGQHDPRDVPSLIQALADGADLVIGSRREAAGAWHGGAVRRAGRALFASLARGLTGLPLSDPTSGLKALAPRAQRLFAAARFPDRFPDADALVLAWRAGLRIVERPARMRPSRNRHSMHDGLGGLTYGANMIFSLLAAATGRDTDLGG